MRSSYKTDDVTLLLKEITGLVEPKSSEEREKLIQKGVHYSEMLPLEYRPSEKYIEAYEISLAAYAKSTADAVCRVSEKIMERKGKTAVIVSLARAGIPLGILIKHYIEKKYGVSAPHYAISIIRGRGIDPNAMGYILKRHNARDIQFVDGWTGKGAIFKELSAAVEEFESVSPELAVLSDPAGLTDLCGTHEDILIPSSCLNSTVSGLISRTFYRGDIIGKEDFHGAAYYGELSAEDVSYDFINAVEAHFDFSAETGDIKQIPPGAEEIKRIAARFHIEDINFIKPGIGEATRVLLRRVPWKLLINPGHKDDPVLLHLFRLAEEKNVPIEFYPLNHYKACGIIKKCPDI